MAKKHYLIIFLVILFGVSSLAQAYASSILLQGLSQNEAKQLKELDCQTNGYAFNQGELSFAPQGFKPKKAIFLLKNITTNTVVIDFPAGHIGASAGITQALPAKSWAQYIYIKGQETLRTENGRQKPGWWCNAHDANDFSPRDNPKLSYCNKYLYICQVNRATINGTPLQKQAYKQLQTNYSWWNTSETPVTNSAKQLMQFFTSPN